LIYLAYIALFLRTVPLFLQVLSFANKNVGSFYFLAFTFFSFSADITGVFFISLEIGTDIIHNYYQILETVIVTFLAIEIGKFSPRIRYILYLFCFFFVISVVSSSFIYNFDFPQDFNWGISRFYILIITFTSALHYVRKMGGYNSINSSPLFGLLGIFIYEALSIIPLLSQQILRASEKPVELFVIYFVFLVSGNLIRDVLISYNALLNLKQRIG